jgi:hypothetical protein
MIELFVALIAMTVTMVVLMLVNGRKDGEKAQRRRQCHEQTLHGLRIHSYDSRGEVLHRCRCGLNVQPGFGEDWCRICADPELERLALRTYMRKRAG